MIDVSKCEYEESFRDEDNNCTVYYFTYPKDLGDTEFYSEEDYGNVVSMCISLTADDGGGFYMQMSPTVEEDDVFMDVDWRSLYLDRNYTEETVQQLLDMAPDILPTEMNVPLSGDYGDDLYKQICEYASDFLSEKTGFCHKGFEIDIQIKASKIQWDTSEG